jgi:hypothetical protein
MEEGAGGPSPKEFGLTAEYVKQEELRAHTSTVPPAILPIAAGIGAVLGSLKWGPAGILLGAAAAFFAVGFCVMAWLMASAILQSVVDPRASRYHQYRQAVQVYREAERRRKTEFWRSLSGRDFEREVARLLIARGYKAWTVGRKGDGGIDVMALRDGVQTIVQCKAWRHDVGPAVVRELYGTLMSCGADDAILATTGRLTKGAIAFLEGKPIQVWDVDDLAGTGNGKYRAAGSTPTPPAVDGISDE